MSEARSGCGGGDGFLVRREGAAGWRAATPTTRRRRVWPLGERDEEVPRSATGGCLSSQARSAETAGEYGGQ